MIWILAGLAVCVVFNAVIVWCCCVAAGRADDATARLADHGLRCRVCGGLLFRARDGMRCSVCIGPPQAAPAELCRCGRVLVTERGRRVCRASGVPSTRCRLEPQPVAAWKLAGRGPTDAERRAEHERQERLLDEVAAFRARQARASD